MPTGRFTTLAEQLAEEIRDGLKQGKWSDKMPGRYSLAKQLGVNHKTCEAALRLLEVEGVLTPGGQGRSRGVAKKKNKKPSAIRVRILLYEKSASRDHFLVDLLHRLREVGHDACFVEKTMEGLGMNVERIIRYVSTVEADVWIVLAGSKTLLEWFEQQPIPIFALFGHAKNIPVAYIGPSKQDGMRELVDKLVELGHQRIVLINREDRRKPELGLFEKGFLKQLESHGIHTGSFSMPDWGDDADDLQEGLISLFRVTPPTAIIIDEPWLFFGVQQHLLQLGIKVPDQVSLACLDHARAFDWCRPEITHLRWSTTSLVNRMVKWVHNISLGKEDKRRTIIEAKLHTGGTIGPARK